MKNVDSDAKNFYEEFLTLEKGETHIVTLFGPVDVKFTMKWEEGEYANLYINDVTPSDNLRLFLNNDGYWAKDDFAERIKGHLFTVENSPLKEFNKKIAEFIERVENFGRTMFGDKDWFFNEYIYNPV